MNIVIFGYSGFIGSHISKELGKINNIFEINVRNITYSSSEKNIYDYFDSKLINIDVIINCSANTKQKNRNDIFINENLSKIIQNYILEKKIKYSFISFKLYKCINKRKKR